MNIVLNKSCCDMDRDKRRTEHTNTLIETVFWWMFCEFAGIGVLIGAILMLNIPQKGTILIVAISLIIWFIFSFIGFVKSDLYTYLKRFDEVKK